MSTKFDRMIIAGKVKAHLPRAVTLALALAAESESPNGEASFASHREALRQELLDIVAGLDGRPSALLPVQLPPLRAPAVAGR